MLVKAVFILFFRGYVLEQFKAMRKDFVQQWKDAGLHLYLQSQRLIVEKVT